MKARTENDLASWIKFFLTGVIKTAEDGVNTFSEILAVEKQNETIAQSLGARSANVLKVLNELYKVPLTDASKVAAATGLTAPSAYKLIEVMQKVGMLREVTGAKRGKMYLLGNYFDIFNGQVKY